MINISTVTDVQGAFGPLKIGPSRGPGGQGIRKKVLVHKIKITYLMVPDNFAFIKKNALFYNPNVCLSVRLCVCVSVCLCVCPREKVP